MDSGVYCNMEVPDPDFQLALGRSENIVEARVGEDKRLADAEEVEELVDVVDGLCSRVEVDVEGVGEVDPAARGGDDGDLPQPLHQVPLCKLHFDEPSR